MKLALWGEVTFREKVLGQACWGPGTTQHELQAPPPSPAKEVNSLPSGDRGEGRGATIWARAGPGEGNRDTGSGRVAVLGRRVGERPRGIPPRLCLLQAPPSSQRLWRPDQACRQPDSLPPHPPCSTGRLCLSWRHWLSHARKSHTSAKARRSQHVRFTDSEFAGGHWTIKSGGIFRDVRDFTDAPSQSVTRSRLCQKVFVSCRGTFPESLTFHPHLVPSRCYLQLLRTICS